MQQKLTIHRDRNRPTVLPSLSLWNFPRMPSAFWNPAGFNPFGWNEDVDDLFETARWNTNRAFNELAENLPTADVEPQVAVSEDQKSLRINVDLPGLKAENIDISTKDDVLTISANKHEKRNGTESRYSFSYSATLPEDIDLKAADVDFSNQKLKINIPKKNEGKKLAINVDKEKGVKSGKEEKP